MFFCDLLKEGKVKCFRNLARERERESENERSRKKTNFF